MLLRRVFVAAGGTHQDWDEFDRVMQAEERTAVLIAPERITQRLSSAACSRRLNERHSPPGPLPTLGLLPGDDVRM